MGLQFFKNKNLFMKNIKQFLFKKILFISFLFTSVFSYAYSQDAPSSHPILLAAPHLPKMVRYDGVGKKFHGEKYYYKKEVNENALKNWMKAYPEEAAKYKETTEKYMSTVDILELSPEEKELYYDLKSQWYIFRQYVF